MSDSGYLTNQLLIAMPSMGDPNFAQTVALVCDHSPRGALGLILNKPLPMRMGEIFEQLEIELAGRPLERTPGAARRTRCKPTAASSCTGPAANGTRPEGFRRAFTSPPRGTFSRPWRAAKARRRRVVALGYAGWDGGQLEDEIRANAWLSAPVECRHHLRHAVRIALACRGAPAGRRAVAHQSDQRQCLTAAPAVAPGRRPRPSPSWSSRSISGGGASASPAATR